MLPGLGSASLLCKLVDFFGSLHWPADSGDMGHFGISYLEVLILFEQWAGHWLLNEKVTWPHVRAPNYISFGRFYLARWVGTCCLGCVIMGGTSVLMGYRPGHWKAIIINAFRRFVWS